MKNKITYGKNVYNQKEIFAVNKVLKNSTQMGKSVQTFEKKIASHFSKKYGFNHLIIRIKLVKINLKFLSMIKSEKIKAAEKRIKELKLLIKSWSKE